MPERDEASSGGTEDVDGPLEGMRRIKRLMRVFGMVSSALIFSVLAGTAILVIDAIDQEPRQARIAQVESSLEEADALIRELEQEFQQRQESLQELERRADRAQALAEMNEQELQAVAETLGVELERRSGPDPVNFATDVGLTFVGVMVGMFGQAWLSRRRATPGGEPDE